MRPFVSGLVLAAGASTHLGQPKQLLPFGDTTLLGHVVAEARAAAALDEVIVVIGGAAAEVRARVDDAKARAVRRRAAFAELRVLHHARASKIDAPADFVGGAADHHDHLVERGGGEGLADHVAE